MVITMSDYLLEQEISTASCDDIYFEQVQAEIEVADSLMCAYAKQLMIEEYAYTEAEDDSSKKSEESSTAKKGFFKSIGAFFKGIFKFIADKLKAFWKWIKSPFIKKTVEKAEEIAESGTEEEAKPIVEEVAKKVPWVEIYTVDDLQDLVENLTSTTIQLCQITEQFVNIFLTKDRKSNEDILSKSNQNVFSRLSEVEGKFNEMKSILAKFSEAKFRKVSQSVPQSYEKSYRKQLGKMCKFANYMTTKGENALATANENLDRMNAFLINEKFDNIDPSSGSLVSQKMSAFRSTLLTAQATVSDFTINMTKFNEGLQQAVTKQRKEINDSKPKPVGNGMTAEKYMQMKRLKEAQENNNK